MKIDTASEQMESFDDTSIEDARWLLGSVVFLAAIVLTAGVVAALISA